MKLVKTAIEGDELVILELTKETFTERKYQEIGRIKFIPTPRPTPKKEGNK